MASVKPFAEAAAPIRSMVALSCAQTTPRKRS